MSRTELGLRSQRATVPRWARVLTLAGMSVVAVVLLGGLVLPGRAEVETSQVVDASVERVLELAEDSSSWESWLLPGLPADAQWALDGPGSGIGAEARISVAGGREVVVRLTESDGSGRVEWEFDTSGATIRESLEVEERDGGSEVRLRIIVEDVNRPFGTWSLLLARSGLRERVESSMSAFSELAQNP